MTPIQFVTSHSFRLLFSMGLMAIATGLAAETVATGAPAAETRVAESTEAATQAVSEKPSSKDSGVSERLRHKNRAVSGNASPSVRAGQQATGNSASAQHQQTDMDFVRESASTKTHPQHTPEWTVPKDSDPGRSEKGGTTDINIGVGENQAAENDEKVD